jgi:DNA-binding IclR family transcriptional regulator
MTSEGLAFGLFHGINMEIMPQSGPKPPKLPRAVLLSLGAGTGLKPVESMGTKLTPTKKAAATTKYEVPALKRAFAILDSLNGTSFGLSVREISREHGIPYSTAFYLLDTMRECGYVQRNDDTKKYLLGHKVFAFRGSSAQRELVSLRAVALPVMEELSKLTGLTTHLATLEEDEAVYIERSEPATFIRLNTWVGKRHHLHCSAVGKALIMYMAKDRVESLCGSSKLLRRTDRTITTFKALWDDLKRSAERGYSIDDAEDEAEGRGVAAPIMDGNKRIVASLGFAGSLSQLPVDRMDPLGKLVRRSADQISQQLGYPIADSRVSGVAV